MSWRTAHWLEVASSREAAAALAAIGVDPVGQQRMAWRMLPGCVKVAAVPAAAANILKQELLACGGDAAVARGTVSCRVEQTDTLLLGTAKQLQTLSARLQGQPFGLPELGRQLQALIQGRWPDEEPVWQGQRHSLDLSRPRLMGIVNATPDSFSDGGCCQKPADAVAAAWRQLEEGADIVDIGGESTRPGAQLISAAEEVARVQPVVETLVAQEFPLPISVDTTKVAVARHLLAAGADYINDISGLRFEPDLAAEVAQAKAGLVLMHSRGQPDTMQQQTAYADLVAEVVTSLEQARCQAEAAGVAPEALVVDPGIGFAKTVGGNLQLLQQLQALKSLGLPVLLGTSRKGFIGQVLQEPKSRNRLYGTLATLVWGLQKGARIFRVHDVAPARQVVDMAHAMQNGDVDLS